MPKPESFPAADKETAALHRAIGARLRQARGSRSRSETARAAKLERHSLIRAEEGEPVSLRVYVRLCRALGLPPRDVLGG